MKLSRVICTSLLIVSAIAMYVQEPHESSPSTSQASTHQDKPARNSKETRRQLERLASGPENIHHRRWTVQGATAFSQQPADNALNYLIRPTYVGYAVQSKLAVDGKWVGFNRVNNYFYLTLEPGRHFFCSEMSEQEALLSLVVVAGKTYYKISMVGGDLQLLDEEEAKKGLAKCRLRAFEEKE